MIVYRLCIAPNEYEGEGEDRDEWYSSLKQAKERRKEIIEDDPYGDNAKYPDDYEIRRIELPRLNRHLVLDVLNREIPQGEVVVKKYVFKKKDEVTG